jgi:para-nitrobenzyl esterase
MQSSVPAGCEFQTLADAQKGTGQRVVKALGCDIAGEIAACLRGKSATEVVSAVPEISLY